MKIRRIYFIVLLFFIGNCSPNKDFTKKTEGEKGSKETNENLTSEKLIETKESSLQSDLEKYKGFYSAFESTDGKLSSENLPKELLDNKKAKINSVNIDYLDKIENGFILTFDIDYGRSKTFVVSTLDKSYNIIDYKTYPNGHELKNWKQDTIAKTSFDKNLITVELLHPNPEEEPDFSTDGIRKEELEITKDLKLNNL